MTSRPTLDRLRHGRPSARVVALSLLGPMLLALVVLALVGSSPIVQRAHLASSLDRSEHLVLIGAPGLSWSDVTVADTPALWSLFRDGSSAAQTVRSVNETTCPNDGWLSLSAGQRAAETGPEQTCAPEPVPTPATDTTPRGSPVTVPGWSSWTEAAAERPLEAHPGLLGQQLQDRDVCVHAHGAGAAIAAADRQGHVPRYSELTDSTGLQLQDCAVQFVDVGAVRDRFEQQPQANEADRLQQVRDVDARVAQVLAQAPPDALIVLTGLADSGQTPHLRLLAVHGPTISPGTLVSASTRQPGLVQSSDVTATILDLFGIPVPPDVSGTPLRTITDPALQGEDPVPAEVAAQDRLQSRLDTGEAAHQVHPLPAPFFVTWGLAQIAAYVVGARRLRRASEQQDPGERAAALRWLATSATVAAAVPVATFLANLVPWWRAPVPYLAVLGAAALFTVLVVGVALLGPWRLSPLGPIAAVMGLTMVVLAADVMTGSSLQTSSLMGLQPVIAGRFYGMGNVTFVLFATAALVLATCLASLLAAEGERRMAALATALIGTIAVLVDGLPVWGADFGGPPALVPAVGYLVLAALGVRLTWLRGGVIVAVTLGLLTVMALLDWTRPRTSRTHLGNFVQSVIDGEAGQIVLRKLEQNLGILLSTPLTMLVPILLAVLIWAVARPGSRLGRLITPLTDRTPLLRQGLIAVLVCWVIGFLVNDSGTAIPAAGATLLIPALIAIGSRTAPRAAPRTARPETSTVTRDT